MFCSHVCTSQTGKVEKGFRFQIMLQRDISHQGITFSALDVVEISKSFFNLHTPEFQVKRKVLRSHNNNSSPRPPSLKYLILKSKSVLKLYYNNLSTRPSSLTKLPGLSSLCVTSVAECSFSLNLVLDGACKLLRRKLIWCYNFK